MANTISQKTIDKMVKNLQRELQVEQELLSKMSPEKVIAYMATKSA